MKARHSTADCTIIADGLDHPEGVAVGPDGGVYAGGEAGQIYRILASGEVETVGTTGGLVLGLCVDGGSNVYACDVRRQAVVAVSPGGATRSLPNAAGHRRMRTPNDVVLDHAGRLVVSDSGDWRGENGCLWLVDADRAVLLRDDVSSFPNGIALDETAGLLYVVESTAARIVQVPYENGTSTGSVETVVALPAQHVPDGVALTASGQLVVGCYTPDVVFAVSGGEVDVLLHDWEHVTLPSPTNVAFAGPERDRLLIACFGGRHIAGLDVGMRGMPTTYPPRLAGDP
jgi:gluconolactonase